MIYKDSTKVEQVEIIIEPEFKCTLHLSNGQHWDVKPDKKLSPSVRHNKKLLESAVFNILAHALKSLEEHKDD